MADDLQAFGHTKLTFLANVAADRSLPKVASRVAILLATKYIHEDNGAVAFPSVSTVATDLGLKDKTSVRDALHALARNGHLAPFERQGQSTCYRMAIRSTTPWAKPIGVEVDPSAFSGGDPSANTGGVDADPSAKTIGVTPPVFAHPSAKTTPTPPVFAQGTPPVFAHPNTLKRTPSIEHQGESLSPPSGSVSKSDAKGGDDSFETFWQTYPRRVGKGAARKSYAAALRRGASSEDLIRAAARFAAERDREPDPAKREKFTPHPATWLNGERYTDDPAPVVVEFPRQGAGHRPSALEMLFHRRGQ